MRGGNGGYRDCRARNRIRRAAPQRPAQCDAGTERIDGPPGLRPVPPRIRALTRVVLAVKSPGRAADPGNNTIRNNRVHGLTLNSPLVVTAAAVGNTWNPSTDGSDANGKYATQLITGSHDGGNFFIFNPASSIQL